MAVFSQTPEKKRFRFLDIIILAFIFVLFYAILRLSAGMDIPFSPANEPVISLDPSMLPYYAGRSLLRMFIAFAASLLFTFIYGYIAAKNKLAQKILIPILDILQSIPVLGFLSATILAFMAFFPGNLLGVECASILAIFTGQAWNMTFSFYHSLVTIPKDLEEASAILHMNWWQKFIHLELPISMISLIWNGMMSFGGGWFFLAASESISVLGKNIHLPGVGSYLAAAVAAGDVRCMVYAMITMLIMILLVDQFFWRPLIVWGQKFKLELSESSCQPKSFIYNIIYQSFVMDLFYRTCLAPLLHFLNKRLTKFADFTEKAAQKMDERPKKGHFSFALKVIFLLFVCYELFTPACEAFTMLCNLGSQYLLHIFFLGFLTCCRVFAALFLGMCWTVPVGVYIGLHPSLSQKMQPVVQIAASFPANMLFPFITVLFLEYNVNFQYGSIALMMLGTQWYILFNVIAGAMSIPNDLLEAASIFKISGWKKWRCIILPCIFSHLVTGFITASGGAWNASIISELVVWKSHTLVATGLGSYISLVTTQGNWAKIIVGIMVMCIFVVLINRLLWQRLYQLSETKYHLD